MKALVTESWDRRDVEEAQDFKDYLAERFSSVVEELHQADPDEDPDFIAYEARQLIVREWEERLRKRGKKE